MPRPSKQTRSADRYSACPDRILKIAWVDLAPPPAWLHDWLADALDCELAGCFRTTQRDLKRVTDVGPDLILAGPVLAGGTGFHWLRCLRRALPGAQVLLLGRNLASPRGRQTMQASIMVVAAAHQPANGASALPEGPAAPLTLNVSSSDFGQTSTAAGAALSAREQEVLAMLAQGARYKEIADVLEVSYNTIHTHVRRIYRKLHVTSAAQAAVKYVAGSSPADPRSEAVAALD